MNVFIMMLIIITLGAVLGSISFRGFYLESLGLLIVGMAFGHFGYTINPIFMELGISFFIYGVALQIGPGFLESFKRDGFKFSIIAFSIALAGLIVAVVFGLLAGFSKAQIAGSYTGAFNSALALVPVLNSYGSEVTKSFGVVYPFSFILMMVFVAMLPLITKSKMDIELTKFKDNQKKLYPPMVSRNFKIANPGIIGKSVKDALLPGITGISFSKISRTGNIYAAVPDFILEKGDIIEAVGLKSDLDHMGKLFGSEEHVTIKSRKSKDEMTTIRCLITNKQIVGKPMNRLFLQEKFGATITRIRRGGFNIPISSRRVLLYGDRVTIVVRKKSTKKVIELLGNDIKAYGKQELYPVFLGITIGALIGIIPLYHGLTIGIPAGILMMGIVAGRIGKIGPIVFTISPHSNHVLKRLGLLMFMATLGTISGTGLWASLSGDGLLLIFAGVFIIFMSLLISLLIARFILRKNIIDVIAIVSGSIACTPALEMSNSRTGQDSSSITYAAIYPLGLLAPMVMANLLIIILRIL